MLSRFFISLSLAALFFLSAPSLAAEEAAKPLSKADVEKIIHDYIMSNPGVILTSVDEHQKKTVEERQGAALDKNKETILRDANSPEAGNPDGDVTVVEFFDYNCGYCKKVFDDVQALIGKDKKLRFVFKDLPILGPASEAAAKWALAAHKQKKYFEYHQALMKNKTRINDDLLEKIAKDVGLDVSAAKNDVAGTEILLQIEKNRSLANSLDLGGTPAFIIGDKIVPGALSIEDIEKRIADVRKVKK